MESLDILPVSQVDTIIKWIEDKTARTSYRLTINMDRKPGLSDTKFGGVPYWTMAREYPRDPGAPPWSCWHN